MANFSCISVPKLVELLTKGHGGTGSYVRVISASRLALGHDPLHPTHVIDLSKEEVRPYDVSESGKTSEQTGAPPVVRTIERSPSIANPKLTRRGGSYSSELNGQKRDYGSLKELLADNLRLFEGIKPGTLEELSRIKPRSKRIVARDPALLFQNGDLAKKYSERLSDGWWYGTNNSAPETEAWLQRACSIAGLNWNQDFKTSLTLPPLTLEELA